MDIRFTRGTFHLGYAYRAGNTAGSLPDEVAKKLVKDGYAVPIISKERPKKVSEEKKEVEPKVRTRPVKK